MLKAHTPHDLACIAAVLGLDARVKSADELADAITEVAPPGMTSYAASAGARGIAQHGWLQTPRPPFLAGTLASTAAVAIASVFAIPAAVASDRRATAADPRGRTHIARTILAVVGLLTVLGFLLAMFMLWNENVPSFANATTRARTLQVAIRQTNALQLSAMQAQCVASVVPGDLAARGFEAVWGPRRLLFPFDHGQHWDVPIESYYFAVNLHTDDGTPASLMLVITRQPVQAPARMASFNTIDHENNQVWSVTGGVTLGATRVATMFPSVVSGALPIVTATTHPFVLRVGEIGLVHDDPTTPSDSLFPSTLTWVDGATDTRLTLRLTNDAYPKDENMLLQFGTGFTPNALAGSGLGMAFYSMPNVVAIGTLTQAGADIAVSGTAWVDHQWGSTFAADSRPPAFGARFKLNFLRSLPQDAVHHAGGWHWFALHMDEDDGSQSHWTLALRRGANTVENAALVSSMAGRVFFDRDGTFTNVGYVSLQVTATAPGTRQNNTKVAYPVAWRLVVRSPTDLIRTVFITNNTGADPQDYHYGKPSTFAKAACTLAWEPGVAPIPSSSAHKGVGFCESVGFGTFDEHVGTALTAIGVPDNQWQPWKAV